MTATDELHRMLGAVEHRKPTTLSQLEAENSKLRDGAAKMAQWYDEELKAALAENAKLRELISVMAYCNQFSRDCDGCSMNGASGIITERAGCDELLARLREMGVEVSE